MPRLKSDNSYLKGMTGIHLWHADMSSCSQRVRITLSEKELSFESHLINLQAGENASEAYQAIHPKGLVPAIVIDGDLIIESIDIIDAIDRYTGRGTLRSKNAQTAAVMQAVMQRANDAHPALKLLTFEFLFSAAPPPSKQTTDAFQKSHRNEYLKAFHRDFAEGFAREKIVEAVQAANIDFLWLENQLSDGRLYLAGSEFSLADIAWMPNVHRFALFQWPFETYPRLRDWFARVKLRQSYREGLLDWEPQGFVGLVTPKIQARAAAGDGVSAYL